VSAAGIGLFGKGRLASAIAATAGTRVVWQVAREKPPDLPVGVAIEASSGAAVRGRVEWALRNGTCLVIGSTGWDSPDLAAVVGQRIGVVVAPNFSLTVALLRRLCLVLGRFCAQDEGRDPYLLEHHHARKHDAPSGTAKLLAAALLEGCPRKRNWAIGGPLQPDQLSVAVLRAGLTYSEHVVGIDAPDEVLELHHSARSAAAYARGALAAADWIQGRRGVHAMDEVAASVLDPLFADLTRGGNR
jgi:4-hydroxy-tetrahydrodipicolinate reductase